MTGRFGASTRTLATPSLIARNRCDRSHVIRTGLHTTRELGRTSSTGRGSTDALQPACESCPGLMDNGRRTGPATVATENTTNPFRPLPPDTPTHLKLARHRAVLECTRCYLAVDLAAAGAVRA